jgi:hypothetical protein
MATEPRDPEDPKILTKTEHIYAEIEKEEDPDYI